MSSGFEETFARIVDRKMAPPIIRWMMGRDTFTAKDYRKEFNLRENTGHSAIKTYVDKGLVEVVHQGKSANNKDHTIYKWVGTL